MTAAVGQQQAHASESRHYLREIARVLRPRARALATWLIHEPGRAAGPVRSTFDFRHTVGEVWTIDPVTPERAIAYTEAWIRTAAVQAGLAVEEPIRHGSWSGHPGFDFQDIVILRRPA